MWFTFSLYKSALLKDPIANVTGFLFRNFERYIRYSFVCEWNLLEFGGRSWRTWEEYLESSGQCSEIQWLLLWDNMLFVSEEVLKWTGIIDLLCFTFIGLADN